MIKIEQLMMTNICDIRGLIQHFGLDPMVGWLGRAAAAATAHWTVVAATNSYAVLGC